MFILIVIANQVIMNTFEQVVVKNFDEVLEGVMVKYMGLYFVTYKEAKMKNYFEDEKAARRANEANSCDSTSEDGECTDEDDSKVENDDRT